MPVRENTHPALSSGSESRKFCNNAFSSPRLSAFLFYDELSQLKDIS